MTVRSRVTKLSAAVTDGIDEILYGRQLAIARYHQAAIDEIAAQPVPYFLTPAAEELLDREAEAGMEASS